MQEYGADCPEPNKNRVYISYLDSVRYFTCSPPGQRTLVYHSILAAYLQHVRVLGFKWVHIWVEPPKAGDEYIFFARPDQHKRPMKRDKLRAWYVAMLERAKEKDIVAKFGEQQRRRRGGSGAVAEVDTRALRRHSRSLARLLTRRAVICALCASPCLRPPGSMADVYSEMSSIREIPMFHGDQWAITIPELLSRIEQEHRTRRHGRCRRAPPRCSPGRCPARALPAPPAPVRAEESDQGGGVGGARLHKLHAQEVVQRAQQEIQARAHAQAHPLGLHRRSRRPALRLPAPSAALRSAQHLKRHFLVAQMRELDGSPQTDLDPEVTSPLANCREVLLGHCQACHWQFNSAR